MNKLEEQLLREETGGMVPTLSVRSSAKIDTGRWWRKTRVWLCVVGSDLVIFAVARRRYVEKLALAECPDSYYNHATGELVIEPGENLRFRTFKMPAKEAIRLLAIINPESVFQTSKN